MNNVYIIVRGVSWGDDEKEIESVHATLESAQVAVDAILADLAKQGYIYTLPKGSTVATWKYKNHFVSIEEHRVLR